jgi:hypothetical protein
MLRLVGRIRDDPRFRAVTPEVSLVSLSLRVETNKRWINIAWTEDERFKVSIVDPPLEFSGVIVAREENVVEAIIGRLARLRET